ncbi:cell envelope integrity protein TolA [Pseudomonas aeruginosa]|uniref:cell envelope integrity protein TolA n=1 Tax=Pseudomonas aeruginosa TaxID=287 RepID=UPI0024ACBB40|nr:cell envelope integrity protein TolA [Pseudomonas aeruginosa]MDI6671951.1 cell envelope integrity protein TolA [Pseudomonas aeruginosa]
MNEKQNALMAVAIGAVVLAFSAGGFFIALDAKKTADQYAREVDKLKQEIADLQGRAGEADAKIEGVVRLVKEVVELARSPAAAGKDGNGKPPSPEHASPLGATTGEAKSDPRSTTPSASTGVSGPKTKALAELLDTEQKVDGPVTPDKVDSLLVERISSNWHRPASAKDGMQVTIEIEMDRKGVIKQVRVHQSSGNKAFDTSAVKAIQDVKAIPEIASLPTVVYQSLYKNRKVLFTPESLGK